MRLSTRLLSTTALALSLVIAQPSALKAAENIAAAQVDQQDLSYAADHLINHVSTALLDLNAGANDKALEEIDAAHKLAIALQTAAPEYTAKKKVQAGRVVYNYQQNDSNYYIPLADESYTKRTYKDGPFWSGEKGLAVKKAEVVYVTLKLDSKKAAKQLEKARAQVTKKSYKDAVATLQAFNKSIVTDEVEADMPLQKARDNFFLARMLMAQKNYDGARYALSNADDGLGKAARMNLGADHIARIKEMRSDLKSLRDNIKENDPTFSDKASGILQQWWDETKGWVQTKV